MASNGVAEGGSFYEDVENLKKLCNFLRTKEGPAIREALLMEKRVHYLKGRLRLNCKVTESAFRMISFEIISQ